MKFVIHKGLKIISLGQKTTENIFFEQKKLQKTM
jgi:hypothetical protein